MNLIIGLLLVLLFGGFILKLIFGVLGFAFKLGFGIVQIVFGLLGWILGGSLIMLIIFAVIGTVLCIPVMFLLGKR